MKYKKIMFMLVLAIFIFGAASVCASDVNDTVIASEDTGQLGLSAGNENEIVEQASNEEVISEANAGTFQELQQNITQGYESYITLDKDYEYEDGFSTDGITITQGNIIIDGQGHKIDAKGKARIFNIETDAVTLINITFMNGKSTDGGAIKWNAIHGIVLDCRFENNTATGDGGAIYWENHGKAPSVNFNVIRGCSFVNNTANYVEHGGGAIYFAGEKYTATVEDCNFKDNSAPNGGAVYFLEGYDTATVTNCNFTGNSATEYGGAVYFDGTGNVTNCNFTNNSATYGGGAVYFYQGTGSLTNCNFTGNTASGDGGAIRISSGTVTNCNFTDNEAYFGGAIWMYSGSVENCNFTGNSATEYGGAIWMYSGSVENCNFTNNSANQGGAVFFNKGTVSNCNFTGNTATRDGGAVYFSNNGTVTNCNFVNNTASEDGGAINMDSGTVSNCNFTGNNATTGSAIYFYKWDSSATLTVSDSTFLNNRANAGALDVVKNDNNITITFTGQNNLLNAIYSREDAEVAFNNVTYWGANGITTVNATLSGSNKAAGQNITVGVVVNNELVLSDVMVTNESGMIVLDISAGENYYISARHDTDSYYTEAERTISNNTKFNVNVTSQTTNNKTVNITAKSNIYSEVVQGKLLFILLDGTEINATYGGNGTWWAMHKFADYSVYQVNASYEGLDDVTVNKGTIAVTAPEHTFWYLNYTINSNNDQVINLIHDFYFDSTYDANFVDGVVINRPVTINGNNYTIDAKSQARIFQVTSSDVVLENITFINGITTGSGGAVYFSQSGRIINCNFADNFAIEGGAVYIGDNGNVLNCNFTANTATYDGGAVFFFSNGTVSNCNFTANTVTYDGGAVYFWGEGSVANCNFTDNQASRDGGAVYFSSNGDVTNCNFTGNTATGTYSYGGAVYFDSDGDVRNCNFTGNTATEDGGAVYFENSGNVTNCNFTDNSADYGGAIRYLHGEGNVKNCNFTGNVANYGGAVFFNRESNVTNCNFAGNNATGDGGAVYFNREGNVTNCNFAGNNATGDGGAVYFLDTGNVTNCNFTGNNANWGSAIYFYKFYSSNTLTVSDSTFLNNRANAEALDIVKNDNNITITFTGQNNLLNAIYSIEDAEVAFTNVTYWGAKGIATVSATMAGSNKAAGQNITVGVVVNDKLVLNEVKVTYENGTIVLNINAGENYYISARHDTDSYYTEAERTISNNTKFNVNVTSQTTNNKTVNITAKSNIFSEVMPGKLLFIVPNDDSINATYAGNGTWWAVYTFGDYGEFEVNATYRGLDNVTINNATITVNKVDSTLTVGDIVFDYGSSGSTTVSFDGATGINASVIGQPNTVVNVKNDTITVSGLDAGTYTLTVTTIVDDNHNNVTKTSKITVNKLKTELTANAITTTYNINKDLVITLKDSAGKALSGVKLIVDLNGAREYVTDANGQVRVSTNGLIPNGYVAKITFAGSAIYKESSANVNVAVKKATPKIIAKKKTYKAKTKTKKFTITLKDNTGKPIKKVKVRLMVKKITKKTKKTKIKSKKKKKKNIVKTNNKGKATFKIDRNKKGKYTAVVSYSGNKYYNAKSVKVKITVK